MENNEIFKILKIVTGSHLYGLNTPQSDEDYVGIMIPTIDYYFGMKNVNEVTENILSKNELGKNTSEAVDCKFYEIREFFKLAFENNPNILEILFAPPSSIITATEYSKMILEGAEYFVGKEFIYRKFLAYAISQKRKMTINTNNYESLLKFYDFLMTHQEKNQATGEPRTLNDINELQNWGTILIGKNGETDKTLQIEDVKFPTGATIKKTKNNIQELVRRVGSRRELILKHGFDVKYASHLIRLLFECKELLDTGRLEFPFTGKTKDIILGIKTGNYKLEEIQKLSEELENECNKSYQNSKVQKTPDFNKIERLLVDILEDFFRKGK